MRDFELTSEPVSIVGSGRKPAAIGVLMSIGGLYVAQSVISGLTMVSLPTVLREAGASLDTVGLLHLAVLPWAIKFLWSPWLDRFRRPMNGRDRSRHIVLAGNTICALGIALVGLMPMSFLPILLCLTLVAFVAATVDIACDGFAVENLAARHHGWANSIQVGGAYLGSALGGGLLLVLVGILGWGPACWVMAVLVLIFGLPFWLSSSSSNTIDERPHRPSLASAFSRRDMRYAIGATILFVVGQKWGLTMLGPFLVDEGLDLATIGMLYGSGSLLLGLGGSVLAGGLVRRFGARPVLVFALVAQGMLLASLAGMAVGVGLPRDALVPIALISSSGVISIGFVALYSEFMRLSDPRQAGVDFTVLQCTDGIASMTGGLAMGMVAHVASYALVFGCVAAIALVSTPVVFVLLTRMDQVDDTGFREWSR
ncbi:MFS transporter [Aureimonas ureilytica]|uniref:MFS transporter n=1 Tax=Aureimonas ureilytica TaxID=401562 RepID=UPI000369E0F6|nr:MFS transporter [Aureimonas ureilytica]